MSIIGWDVATKVNTSSGDYYILVEGDLVVGFVYEFEDEWMAEYKGQYLHSWQKSADDAKAAVKRGAFEGCEDTP